MNRKIEIHFNWALVLAMVMFWSYGLYGTVSNPKVGILFQSGISLFLGLILFFFLVFSNEKDSPYRGKVELEISDLVVAIFYLCFFILFSWRELNDDLAQDEWYHAERSQLIGLVVATKVFSKITFFQNILVKNILVFLNFLFLGGFAAFCLAFKRLKDARLPLVIILFFTFRILVLSLGGSSDPHPPFRLFPLWFSSTLFTLSPFSLHFGQTGGLLLLAMIVFKVVKARSSLAHGLLAGLAAGTIPVLWHAGVLCEQSIWTALVWTTLCFFLISLKVGKVGKAPQWAWWFSFLTVGTLMRQTAIFGFVPLLLAFVIFERKSFMKEEKWIFALFPILPVVPFFAQSLLMGTPSTQSAGIGQLREISSLSFLINSIQKDVFIPAMVLALLTFLPIKKEKRLNQILLLIFFVGGWLMFHSIQAFLWEVGRYKAEYFVPFSIVGLTGFTIFLHRRSAFLSKIALMGLSLLIVSNTWMFRGLLTENLPVDLRYFAGWRVTRVLSTFVYDYRSALRDIKAQGFATQHYIFGVTYGTFPEVLAGYSLSETLADQVIFKDLCETPAVWAVGCKRIPTVEDVNLNRSVQSVLIADSPSASRENDALKKWGWKENSRFFNPRHGSTILNLVR